MRPMHAYAVALLALLCLSCSTVVQAGSTAAAVKACTRAAGKAGKHKQALCEHATGSGSAPPRCWAEMSKVQGLKPEHKLKLCQRAVEGSPYLEQAACLKAAPNKLGADARTELCLGADSDAPGKCAANLRVSRLATELQVQLCSRAVQGSDPAQCYATAASSLSESQAAALCARFGTKEHAACAKGLAKLMQPAAAVAVCAGTAQPEAVQRCSAAAFRSMTLKRQLKEVDAGAALRQLCSSAASEAPAECAHSVTSYSKLSLDQATRLCRAAASDAPATCLRSVSSSVARSASADDLVQLCRGAASNSPADCVNALPYGFDTPAAISLCTGAASAAPAACVTSLNTASKFSAADKVAVCRHSQSNGPSECIAALPFGVSTQDAVQLCAGAPSAGPAECLAAMGASRQVSMQRRIEMCRGVASAGAGMAVSACLTAAGSIADAVAQELCRDAPRCASDRNCAASASPVACFNAIYSVGMSAMNRARLCQSATSIGPAVCASEAPGGVPLQPLCRHATNAMPAKCMAALIQGTSHARHSLSLAQQLRLCVGADSAGPAQCAAEALQHHRISAKRTHHAPGFDSVEDVVNVCQAAADASPVACAIAASTHLDSKTASRLCALATSKGPAQCAKAADDALDADSLVALCRGAASSAPGACISKELLMCSSCRPHMRAKHPSSTWLPADLISKCRLEVPRPDSIDVLQAVKGCDVMLPGCKFAASLLIVDPYGMPYTQDGLEVVASLPHSVRLEGGLEGTLSAVPHQGLANFENLTITVAGDWQIKFQVRALPRTELAGGGVQEAAWDPSLLEHVMHALRALHDDAASDPALSPQQRQELRLGIQADVGMWSDLLSTQPAPALDYAAAIDDTEPTFMRVNVHSTAEEHDPNLFDEDDIWGSATRLDQSEAACWRILARSMCPLVQDDATYIVPSPWSFVALSASCQPTLELNSASILGGWGSALWLRASKGAAWVLTHRVPSASMPAHERLGVEPGASTSQIRRAYYDRSLEWHPDRWSDQPEDFRDRAAKVFALIAEAYAEIGPAPRKLAAAVDDSDVVFT